MKKTGYIMKNSALIPILALILASPSLVARAQFLGQQSLSRSSYIIDKDGKLDAWGLNSNGQLGIGDTNDRNFPVRVGKPPAVTKWVLLAGGARHALAVGDSDKLYSWGFNGDGELGVGSTTEIHIPSRVTNPAGVTAWKWVSAGADHSVALASNGMLYSWGGNSSGQLGTGDLISCDTPRLVKLPAGVQSWAAVAAGAGYTIAISNRGELYDWGTDTAINWTNLGFANHPPFPNHVSDSAVAISGNTLFRTNCPLPTIAASSRTVDYVFSSGGDYTGSSNGSVISVAVGDGFGIELVGFVSVLNHSEKTFINTFGDNTFGQQGNGFWPLAVTQWVAVAAGLRHCLALGNDGNLYAWGSNLNGELGIASGMSQSAAPVIVGSFGDSLRIAGSLTGPAKFQGAPFQLSLTVSDTSNQSVSMASAFLVVNAPIRYNGSAPFTVLSPSTLSTGQQAVYSWNVDADSVSPHKFSESSFAYIRAVGSAPLFVFNKTILPVKTYGTLLGFVFDSITKAPLADARVIVNGNDILLTHSDGTFEVSISTNSMEYITITCENYLSQSVSTIAEVDTFSGSFGLAPSPIHGVFSPVKGEHAFSKLFFEDSLNAYAVEGDTLFKSSDGGGSWYLRYIASAGFEDIFFRSANEGWVVGGAGTILHTVNGGIGWENISPSKTLSFHGVCGVNDNLWVVGDSGTILRFVRGTLQYTPSPTYKQSLYAVHFIDTSNGIAVGDSGLLSIYRGYWYSALTGNQYQFKTCYCSAPGCFYAAGTDGKLLVEIDEQSSQFFPYTILMQHTMRGLYFLNPAIGFVVGDSGANFVTYDSGYTWAQMTELNGNSLALNFFGVHGWDYDSAGLFSFDGVPAKFSTIVRGRITGDHGTFGIAGVPVTLRKNDGSFYSVETNEVGNYVFTDVPAGTGSVQMTFQDTAGNTWYHLVSLSQQGGVISVVNFDTSQAHSNVSCSSESSIDAFCVVDPGGNSATLQYSTIAPGAVHVAAYDVLGRKVADLFDGYVPSSGTHSMSFGLYSLPSGVYFVSDGRSRAKFVKE
jgi:photosystem II stability/assembly factor-like uncharacterized protein